MTRYLQRPCQPFPARLEPGLRGWRRDQEKASSHWRNGLSHGEKWQGLKVRGTRLPPSPADGLTADRTRLRNRVRHCEARSAVAIHVFVRRPQWIASFLAMTGLECDDGGSAVTPYPVIASGAPASSSRGAQRRGNPCLHAIDHGSLRSSR
jgi:hypothetical protein